MHTMVTTTIPSLFSCTALLCLLFNTVEVHGQDVYLCVWRNPERTMTRIFPEAKDYVTKVVKISNEQRGKIEKRLGHELLPGQRETFQYFEMIGAENKRIGTLIAASQKGQYGAIEFVVGVDTTNTIIGLYVQRSRERDRSFKKRSFLDLFIGKKITPIKNIDTVYPGDATPGSTAVIRGLKKEFVVYEELLKFKESIEKFEE